VRKKRLSVEQITGILKQAELGTPVQELCRVHGVSEQSYYRWKKIYGGMEPSESRELKSLREENVKLKRPVANLSLDKAMLQDVLQKKSHARLRFGYRRIYVLLRREGWDVGKNRLHSRGGRICSGNEAKP
jgi:putative transposase